ncbi:MULTISPECIES: RDD family protein [Psychrobacter]|uniref:RDD family protein n=1 Tax=Psychrobacter TaxID=497 RepID=UPI001CB6D0BA|nr:MULTISPECIES: RDD family protein [Psychrobacter]
MQIYLARNNVQAGPYSVDQLNIMLASGEVVLDDLVWHDGMSNWQRLGDVTDNQLVYRPLPVTNSDTDNDSIITNVTDFPEDNDPKNAADKVSVDRLYGKPERPKSADAKFDMTTNREHQANSRVSLSKAKSASAAIDQKIGNVVLAPVMLRVLATLINGILYVMAILPLIMALGKMDIDYSKFQNIQNMDAAYKYSMVLMESIPSTTLMVSQVLVFGLFGLQLLFIMLRGQSIGKLITGIRVVDQTTHKLPSFTKLVGVRTLLLLIIYNLLFSYVSIFGFVVVAINYILAARSPENMGWHDKLAKTLVVRADNSQLKK